MFRWTLGDLSRIGFIWIRKFANRCQPMNQTMHRQCSHIPAAVVLSPLCLRQDKNAARYRNLQKVVWRPLEADGPISSTTTLLQAQQAMTDRVNLQTEAWWDAHGVLRLNTKRIFVEQMKATVPDRLDTFSLVDLCGVVLSEDSSVQSFCATFSVNVRWCHHEKFPSRRVWTHLDKVRVTFCLSHLAAVHVCFLTCTDYSNLIGIYLYCYYWTLEVYQLNLVTVFKM